MVTERSEAGLRGRPQPCLLPIDRQRSELAGREDLSSLGIAVAGGGVALARKLYRVATFSYDGTQYKGRIVEPITPNELFYCVTKNVVDPKVNVDLWHLEVNGLVQNRATWRFQDFVGLPAHDVVPKRVEVVLAWRAA